MHVRCLVSAFAVIAAGVVHAQQSVTPSSFERTGVFASAELTESSGVAASRRQPGVLWTHNDSDHDPILYATDLTGAHRGAVRLEVPQATDWEDIALAPCPEGVGDCIYLADTGDNLERRAHVVIYVFPEPELSATAATVPSVRPKMLVVRYPDGAHDVEAIAVSPMGEIYLITKGRSGHIQAFCITRTDSMRDTVTAQPVGTLPLGPMRRIGQIVTGAAISSDGQYFVIRTYTELFFYKRTANGAFVPDGPACWIGYQEPQGEGIDFLNHDTFVLTSEAAFGQRGTLSRVRCPRP